VWGRARLGLDARGRLGGPAREAASSFVASDRVDWDRVIPHKLPISTSLIPSLDEIVLVGSDERLTSGKYMLSRRSDVPTIIVATLLRDRRSGPAT
jgi:hypothetical protein